MKFNQKELDFLKKHQNNLQQNKLDVILADYKNFGSYQKLNIILNDIGKNIISKNIPSEVNASISIPTESEGKRIKSLLGAKSPWVFWIKEGDPGKAISSTTGLLYDGTSPGTRKVAEPAPVYMIVTFPDIQLGRKTIDEYDRIPTIGQVVHLLHAATGEVIGCAAIISEHELLIFVGEDFSDRKTFKGLPMFEPFDKEGKTNKWEDCSLKKEIDEAFNKLLHSGAFEKDQIKVSFI